MKRKFKIGDTVIVKTKGKAFGEYDGIVSNIVGVTGAELYILSHDNKNMPAFFARELELVDVQREQLLELESIL